MDLEQTLNKAGRELDSVAVDANRAFYIIVKNEISGLKRSLYVLKDNILDQVFDATSVELKVGFDKSFARFVNETTGVSTMDTELTLGNFKVEENTVITITLGRFIGG